jgi:hypothetical protein
MSLVQMGLVFDMQALGRERRQQFCRDDVGHSHRGWLSDKGALRSMSAKIRQCPLLILSSLEAVSHPPA